MMFDLRVRTCAHGCCHCSAPAFSHSFYLHISSERKLLTCTCYSSSLRRDCSSTRYTPNKLRDYFLLLSSRHLSGQLFTVKPTKAFYPGNHAAVFVSLPLWECASVLRFAEANRLDRNESVAKFVQQSSAAGFSRMFAIGWMWRTRHHSMKIRHF